MNWFQRVLSHYGEPSTKRHIVAGASMTLCGITALIGVACAVWIHANGDLGSGAVAALTFAGGITASLAGVAYRKRDGAAAPSAPGDGDPVGCAKPQHGGTSAGGGNP